MNLANKKILLGMTGGIAAYKSAELCRHLVKAGAQVKVVMTHGAKAFITPLTMQALSGHPVHDDLLDPSAEAAMGHIELARWPDLIVIAPATADFIARTCSGRADDLLSTLCLASAKPIAIAPAMNQQMWANPATQANIQLVSERNFIIWGPDSGEQACGDIGYGRMLEPQDIAELVDAHFNYQPLKGQKWLITAGPTREEIDPVRYLSNRSSGKMGFAIAEAAAKRGAEVILVAGPVSLTTPLGVQRLDVVSANDMLSAVQNHIESSNTFVGCAAVSDYRADTVSEQKMKKKEGSGLAISLVQNPDILHWVANSTSTYCVGFAAETQNIEEYATAKMARKNIPMICANDVSRADIGFSSDHNELTIFYNNNKGLETKKIGPELKSNLALELVDFIGEIQQQTEL